MQVITSDTAITKSINVGTIGKASTVKLYGCTFSDLTTTRAITGAVSLDVVIPAPKSVSDSTLAEVFVDGARFETFQVITSGVRQFDPRYLVRPFMKEDADLAYGPVLASPASPMVFIDLSTLPKLSAMPAVCNFIYYDYVTDTMYYFGSITALSTITASTQVWTESFASDPVVDYMTVANTSGAIGYHFIFTASGKVIELFAPVTANFKQTRTLPHKIKSATAYYVDSTASAKYGVNARIIVLDDKGNIYKYKLTDLTLIGSVLNTNIIRLTGSSSYYVGSGTGVICAISSEPRANMYLVDAAIANPPTLTRQALNASTQNMQFIDPFSIGGYGGNGGRWLAYDFSINKLVYVNGIGGSVFGYDFTPDNNMNVLGGRLIYGYSQTASTDGVVRSLYQNLMYTSAKNYVGDKAWPWMSGDSNYSIGRIRKVAKSYLIDGSSYSLSDMPSSMKFNGKSLSFKLAPSTPTGFKIVLPPALSGSILVNGIDSDLTVPDAEVQITFATAPDQTSYVLAIGHTLVSAPVDGMYILSVGEASKTSTVTLFGCTFADDGLTSRTIVGIAEIKVSVPAPTTPIESNIAEVYVDGVRATYYVRHPYAEDLTLRKFNPAYFTRPYIDGDIDSSKGILKVAQASTAGGLPTFVRIDTLAQRAARPAQTKYCYYDYYTNKMYWFEVSSPDQITAASYVYVEDFSADPLACYQQLAYVKGSGYYGEYIFTVLFHKSGKVRMQHPFAAAASYVRQLPHDIVAGCAYNIVFTDSFSLDGTEVLLVSDSAGNLYQYTRLKDGVTLFSTLSGHKIVKLVSPHEWVDFPPKVMALTDEDRLNAYVVNLSGGMSLTRQPSNPNTINTQTIGASTAAGTYALLLYDFALNTLRMANLDGTDYSVLAHNLKLLSGTGGLIVNALSNLVSADAYLRSGDSVLPHVTVTLGYANGTALIDSSSYYDNTTINGCVYNNKADTYVEGIVANAVGPTVVESILYDWTGTNTEGKKVKYIDVYNWDGTQYVLHETLNTSPVVVGKRTESLVLSTPMLLHSSRKIKLAARTLWGGYSDSSYRWVTELNVMIRSA